MAWGSIVSQAPAWRRWVRPSGSSGRTTRTAEMAVVRTIAAFADAAASKICCELHHGGKATATISAPGRTCNDTAAMAIQPATSNAAALDQLGHRNVVLVDAPSIATQDIKLGLTGS